MATPVSSDPVAASSGRTGRLPRSARRRQLLTAAQEVFVANGYHAAAMDDIADRAGVSKPVLYQHFPGKLDLYLALIDQHTESLVNHVTQALAGTTDNKVRVHLTTKAYFDFIDGEGEAFRLVFESDLRNEPAVRERVERASQLCMEAIADTIGHDTGVSRERAELLAVGLTGASEIAARYWLNANRAVPKDEAVALLSTLLWRGISDFPLEREPDNSAQR